MQLYSVSQAGEVRLGSPSPCCQGIWGDRVVLVLGSPSPLVKGSSRVGCVPAHPSSLKSVGDSRERTLRLTTVNALYRAASERKLTHREEPV